jgi:hypothetical protein
MSNNVQAKKKKENYLGGLELDAKINDPSAVIGSLRRVRKK